jgi:hypothetical protein
VCGAVSVWLEVRNGLINSDRVTAIAVRQWADSSERKIVYSFAEGTEWSESFTDERWAYLLNRLL